MSRTIKRFYKQAATAMVEGGGEGGGGFTVRLDGRPIKTPGGRLLVVPTAALAEAIAAEWQEQGDEVRPDAMPMTQLSSTAIDRVGPERAAIQAQLMGYAGTDLLCYRAEMPADLVRRQTEAWQPLLDWAALALDAPLAVTTSVVAIEQRAETLAALARHLDRIGLWTLTAVQAATAATGSLVLALALAEGRVSAAEAFGHSQLDETFQIEQWGEDYEAADRRAALARDIDAAGALLRLAA
jgi:chaperone required for assembly of F1-ATPase